MPPVAAWGPQAVCGGGRQRGLEGTEEEGGESGLPGDTGLCGGGGKADVG